MYVREARLFSLKSVPVLNDLGIIDNSKGSGVHIADVKADLRTSFSLVHELDGHLDVSENAEHGTSYIISVPAIEKLDPNKVLKLEPSIKILSKNAEVDDAITEEEDINILIIEDEASIREILTEILEEHNIKVDGASNGADGLEALKTAGNNKYELIFLDLRMPVMDGVDFMRKLTEQNIQINSRIYIITGGLELTSEEKSIVRRVDGILQKPFNPDDLINIIDQYRKGKHGQSLLNALERDII